jgi:tetratricopeptide (TPR) repeat protein
VLSLCSPCLCGEFFFYPENGNAPFYNNNGLVYLIQGRCPEALEQYRNSLKIRERLAPGSLAVAQSYNNIGEVYKAQGKLPEALEQYRNSLEIRERLAPDSLAVAASYSNIGTVYYAQGQLLKALDLFRMAYTKGNCCSAATAKNRLRCPENSRVGGDCEIIQTGHKG